MSNPISMISDPTDQFMSVKQHLFHPWEFQRADGRTVQPPFNISPGGYEDFQCNSREKNNVLS